jgi:5-methylcytosine-specific restriction enzyme A
MPNCDQRASAAIRGYGHRWRKARLQHLTQHPLCVMCLKQGKRTRATVVDHIKPHRGDRVLFWSMDNWQSLCEQHHNSTKQAQDLTGVVAGVDAEGRPIYPDHPWNKGGGGRGLSFFVTAPRPARGLQNH